MRLFRIQSGFQSGVYNMALDEALLEWVRAESQPTLIVRTYQWESPTLSLGVNQTVRDVRMLLAFYGQHKAQVIVRRPTGGRAILHGEDVSFSFTTNEPLLLKQSLKASYEAFSGIVQRSMQHLDLPVTQSAQAQNKDYLRSPVCFETHTPSDLLSKDGQKLAGSAQLRRLGGLLQHGAAFLRPHQIPEDHFSRTLFQMTAEFAKTEAEPFPLELIGNALRQLQTDYLKMSNEIWLSASTTNGSHLEPASR